ncbi:DEAD/DEAH box helicase family protein [Zooshikella sp. RANM57]|uniref:DEAD/DEAH box helicase family protein n=1 Tax=Zooshikella sp. RANM57 TaxID=3425863 RepID=UPI003D6DE98C
MGTISIIKNTLPSLIRQSFMNYFSPLWLGFSFFKGLLHKASPSKRILEYEYRKIKSNIEGQRWPEIRENIDEFYSSAAQRAIIRDLKINWITLGKSVNYELLYDLISKDSRYIENVLNKTYLDSFIEVKKALESNDASSSYSIILVDEAHRAATESDVGVYEKIFESLDVFPVFFGFTATPFKKESGKSKDYISIEDESSRSEIMIAAKALELKIEEVLSRIEGLIG